MRIGFSEVASRVGWRRGGRHRGWWRPGVSSPRAARAERKQLASDLIEIGQCEHGVRAGQVLGQAPVPRLDEPPQMLDHAEGMLAARAGSRAGAIDLLPALAQRCPGVGAPIDSVAHPAGLIGRECRKFRVRESYNEGHEGRRKGMATNKGERIGDEVVDQLLEGRDPATVFESGGLVDELKKRLAERMLNGELEHHLGTAVEEEAGNHRNGYGSKTVLTDTGKLELAIPRDRHGRFDPVLIGKYRRRFAGFDDKIIALYAR